VISRHHWIIVNSIITIPVVNKDWLYRWNHLIIPTIVTSAPIAPVSGHGL
jgi:hypothetical protein